MSKNILSMATLFLLIWSLVGCQEESRDYIVKTDPEPEDSVTIDKFYFGADLSYVNQILDHAGVYKDEGIQKDPYEIFASKGTNLVRLRLWHNPAWTKEVYGASGTQLYNDLYDVEKAIAKSKAQGMEVLLDFHYSDDWADPGKQKVPAAWVDISDITTLGDSVYNYTYEVLSYLNGKGLMPELVQVGNETNCGMMLSGRNAGFPNLNVCESGWANFGSVAKRAISAIRDVNPDTKILFHVADPENVDWWFNSLINTAGVKDFDMIGFSYYPVWHTTIRPHQLEDNVAGFVSKFNKEVVILETAYPWTTAANDSYPNLFGGDTPLTGYPYTLEGQLNMMIDLTQSMISAGGSGIVYWEPAWITSEAKDQWNTGSSWESNTFFDFDGNAHSGFDFIKYEYDTNE